MSFIEFVAFLFTMFGMVWMMMRRVRERKNPPDYEDETEEEKEQLREFMKVLNIRVDELEPEIKRGPPKAPKRIPRVPEVPKQVAAVKPLQDMVHFGAYSLRQKPSRLKQMVKNLPSQKQIMIFRELLNPPKGLE